MKKHIFLSFLLIALFLSCTKQEQENPVLIRFDYPVFYASFESSDGPATRTYADPQHRVRWNKGDRVSIFNGNTINLEYMFEGETGDSTGTFRIVEEGNKSSVQTRSVSYKYAVYPYDKDCTMGEDGTLTVTFPSEQSYVPNSFGPMDNTMISISEDDTLFFRNVGGYLILKLYGDTTQVTSITLKGNKDEPICGKGYVTVPSDGFPSVRMSEEGTPTLTLLCESPIPLSASSKEYKEFWFVVPPVTFTEGFTVVIEDSEGRRMTKSTSRSVTVERNQRFRMTPLDVPALPATQFVRFEDPNFKAYCVANFDTNWDGGIDLDEAAQISSVSLPYSPKIFSLAGIEFFKNLTSLFCYNHQLTSLDISHNTDLKTLWCQRCGLSSLDVRYNTKLSTLRCNDNQLTSLDISHNKSLTSLDCSNNQLSSLDISSNTDLTYLTCDGNTLSALDVSHNTKLTSLSCDNNQLTSLDVSQNRIMGTLRCKNNHLSSLDVSQNTSLGTLDCRDNQLTSLDLRHNTNLRSLNCKNNQLTSLDIYHHPNWESIYCDNNQLTSLDVSGCLCLKNLSCENNHLTFIDLRSCPLVQISGENNPWEQILRRIGQRDISFSFDDILPIEWCEPDEPEAIDLGLPSGVLWGSFNLWASRPEEYGEYYAWGEVSAFGDEDPENENLDPTGKYLSYLKYCFSWETYKWGNGGRWPGEGLFITKYCNDSSFGLDGFTDNLLTLEPEDDAASWLFGGQWRMPTAEEWLELEFYCTWEACEINGVPGVRAKSRVEGYEDRWIFFPLPGLCLGSPGYYELWDEGETGNYWSSSLEFSDDDCITPIGACRFEVDSRGGGLHEDSPRYEGCSIRPVKSKPENE